MEAVYTYYTEGKMESVTYPGVLMPPGRQEHPYAPLIELVQSNLGDLKLG
jgi:hypothetical protein